MSSKYRHREARRALSDEELEALARMAHAKTTAVYRQAAEARKLTAQLLDELLDESDTEEETDAHATQDSAAA